jgi:hypothetical protein
MFAMPLQVVLLDVLAGSLVEMVFQVHKLICDGTCQRPHCISQANRGSLIRSTASHKLPYNRNHTSHKTFMNGEASLQVHRCQITILMYHRHGRMYLLKVNLMQFINRILRGQRLIKTQPNHLPRKRRIHRHPDIQIRIKSDILHARLRRVARKVPALVITVINNGYIWVVHSKIRVCCREHGPLAGMGVRSRKARAR